MRSSSTGYPIDTDGKVTSAWSGRVHWDPSLPAQLTRTFGYKPTMVSPCSAAAASICFIDAMLTFQEPFWDELPQAVLEIIAAEPTGAIAHRGHSYSHYICTVYVPGVYICTVYVPGVQHVSDMLKAHSTVTEWPIKE